MSGYIIAVMGGKRGQGKSQVAANLAFAWTGETKAKVLLLDFDQRASGDLNLITGINGKKTIKDLSDFSGAIDPRSLTPFLTAHPTGVSYIGMPNDPNASENVNIDGLGKTLKAVTNIFPLTILDLGSEISPLAQKALEYTTMVFLVVTPDILALNQTKRLYNDLVTMMYPKDMLQIILNQYVKGHPVTPEVVSKTIGKPVFSPIPKDEQTCVMALNRKMPAVLVAKNSAFTKGMVDTVRKVVQKSVLKTLAALTRTTPAPK